MCIIKIVFLCLFSGGVYPPAAAFYETNLISRLERNGIKFEILDV